MSLEVCVLASGSSGNSIYVASQNTRILIDAGLSAKQVAVRLEQIGVAPEHINGICISHEHGDHVAGIRVLQKRHSIPVYVNAGTLNGSVGGFARTWATVNQSQTATLIVDPNVVTIGTLNLPTTDRFELSTQEPAS